MLGAASTRRPATCALKSSLPAEPNQPWTAQLPSLSAPPKRGFARGKHDDLLAELRPALADILPTYL